MSRHQRVMPALQALSAKYFKNTLRIKGNTINEYKTRLASRADISADRPSLVVYLIIPL